MEKKEVTVSDTGVNMFVDSDKNDFDNKPVETVLTSMKLATIYFTPQYLYSLNECRRLAILDPSSITTSEYWDRHRHVRQQYGTLDQDTKTIWEAKAREHIHKQPQMIPILISIL